MFITYAVGSKLANCYSEVSAETKEIGRNMARAGTNNQYAFLVCDPDEMQGMIEKFDLKKVPVQPQGAAV